MVRVTVARRRLRGRDSELCSGDAGMMRWLRGAIIVVVSIAGLAPLASAEPVLIVHPECAATADLEKVRRIFLGKERSLCGDSTVAPIDVDEASPLRALFLEKVVDKSEAELRQYWSRLIFTGKATPPRQVGNDDAVKAWVARNKDAIGLIDSKQVDASVKVLLKL